ncbi:hypothetical protein NLU13_3687 [Sarocladium strictum]|uniref:Carboxylic ester hydrolase n=1 Tax=Sarocladium strictum TaxID=5046 RepID=A0AA39GPC6_SARSR|nr:hypothetical protein NLU13_3687 [Sarocladium strictum]
MYFLTTLTLFGSCFTATNAVKPLVDLGYSKYQGLALQNGVTQWLGMRYAAPPTAHLRFARPRDPPFVEEIQQADQPGKVCLGTDTAPGSDLWEAQSEDCLFINLSAPTNATAESRLPVYVYLSGGGFVRNSDAGNNGTGLVVAGDHSLIVVNFGYRVGAFGFLTDGDELGPNNGLWDQVRALEWVQTHIASFGGDPGHVVLGGASAGAGAVAYHLTRDGGRDHGLFAGAAAQSVSGSNLETVRGSRYLYETFAIRAGCAVADSARCLRAASTEQLQLANFNVQPMPGAQGPPLYGWNPVIDGDFIVEPPDSALEKGHFIKVPVLTGDDTNGGSTVSPRTTTTFPDMNTFMRNQFPWLSLAEMSTIWDLYDNPNRTCPNTGCRWRQLSDAYGQMRYTCPSLRINELYAAKGSQQQKTWAYRWNVEDPAQMADGLGVPHVVELSAIWGPEYTGGRAPSSYYHPAGINAHAVAVAQGYWTSFIRTLDPNTYRVPGSAEWKPFSLADKRRLLFNTAGRTEMETLGLNLTRACAFFAKIRQTHT